LDKNTPQAEIVLHQYANEGRLPMGRQIAVCVGMSWWKRRRIGDFFATANGRPVFRNTVDGAIKAATARGGAIAVWASREPPGLARTAAALNIPLVRVEDGFLRSVGLGSDFLPGLSITLDETGIYFDPERESDLERLLRYGLFDVELLARARRLIDRLIESGVTKYNLKDCRSRIPWPTGRRRILVPGQVEDDLSVLFGGGVVRGNLDLLARVRAANPEAFIVYKPHPDVVAGHRKGAIRAAEARCYADWIAHGDSIVRLIDEIDELHTLTSLAGFEALLRGVPVHVYGRPFYAGWGLTRDVSPWDRGRRLSLDELTAGALILYPRYLDPATRRPCEPETVIDHLVQRNLWRPGLVVRARRLQGVLVQALRPCVPLFARR
jgi:capsular polysaccharide export protein